MRPFTLILALALVDLSIGCGDKTPTRPSGSVPAVTGLEITGADAVLTGLSARYTVTATLSDGTTRTGPAAWTSSPAGVATVDTGGRLEGRAHGSTTLTASFEGRTVSKTVQVVTNYGGTWDGRYVIRACTDTGELTDHDGGWCANGPGRVGTVAGLRMTFVQSGSHLREITGTIVGYPETIAGAVSAEGRLSLGGTLTLRNFDSPDAVIATLEVSSWETTLDGSRMTGRWAEDFTSFAGCIGTAHMEHELVMMTRVSTSVLSASAIPF
jgi:hypothetical protein